MQKINHFTDGRIVMIIFCLRVKYDLIIFRKKPVLQPQQSFLLRKINAE